MAQRIVKIAELVGSEIALSVKSSKLRGEFAAILTQFEPVEPPGPIWTLSLVIGSGTTERKVTVSLSPFLTPEQFEKSRIEPIAITPLLTIFRNRFFLSEREAMTPVEHEEMILRAKKIVYDEEAEVIALRSFVSNIEAAVEFQQSGPKRETISDDVKLLVWSRDGGACIRCGSKERLHFDHIIPVAKGGSNCAANVQLLCQPCNLKKSDKIAF